MDNSKNRLNDHLGVNKMGKNIRKSPLHQPNFSNNNNTNNNNNNNINNHNNNPTRQQPQPQVYNISKNDFRNIVQQLTGSPSQDPLPRPPQNPPKPQSMRLQRIRPPPLTPINRPPLVHPAPVPVVPPPSQVPYNPSFVRPGQFGQLQSPIPMQPFTPGEPGWTHPAESPITAYMKYLQTSFLDPSPRGIHGQPVPQQHLLPPGQPHPQASGLLPNPNMAAFPSPRMPAPMPPPPPMPNLPPPQVGGPPPLLPSPTSQFLLPSPTAYFNLLSPRSPYPLLSPGMQFPPLTPNFAFSPMGQSGILGPGPQPPLSPGLVFPLSPPGFLPILSPRWRDQ